MNRDEKERQDIERIRQMIAERYPGQKYNGEIIVGGKHIRISSEDELEDGTECAEEP